MNQSERIVGFRQQCGYILYSRNNAIKQGSGIIHCFRFWATETSMLKSSSSRNPGGALGHSRRNCIFSGLSGIRGGQLYAWPGNKPKWGACYQPFEGSTAMVFIMLIILLIIRFAQSWNIVDRSNATWFCTVFTLEFRSKPGSATAAPRGIF
jgi:hypothetical protein